MTTHLDRVEAVMARGSPLLSELDRDEIRSKLRADATQYERRLAELEAAGGGPDDRRAVDSLRASLVEVNEALLRLDTSEYGYCADCGRWIAVARLLALPHTRYCIECAGRH